MTLFELELPKAHEVAYLNMVKEKLIDRIDKGVKNGYINQNVHDVLIPKDNKNKPDDSIIDGLLINEPEKLFELNERLVNKISIFEKFDDIKENLLKVFDYDGVFNTPSKFKAYKLSSMIGANTCCYCNRQYTFTIVKDGRENSANRISRPAFDHWFPKSEYPMLSLSLYNLIPSCTICNSSAKGQQSVNLEEYIHPYVHLPKHPSIKFVAEISTEPDRKWTIKIDRAKGSKEDKTISLFCLDAIYKEHDKLELKDMMDFIDNYPNGYLKDLIPFIQSKSTSGTITRKDVYRMLFGIEYDDDKHLNRPFGKLKNDILKKYL